MPMNRGLYPKDWDSIAHQIKSAADWTCVECGRPCRRPGESVHALEDRVNHWPDAYKIVNSEIFCEIPVFADGRFTLTVAHLDHQPANCDPGNLRAWCAPCHGRYDLAAIRSGAKDRARLERAGQLRLF